MTLSEQFVSIILMILSGIFVGAVVDCIRVTFSALSPKSFLRKFTIGVELIVWACLGALTFYTIYLFKGGEWRLVDPIAQISGILLYESVFQPFFRFIGRMFLLIVIKPIFVFCRFILLVLGRAFALVIGIILFIIRPFRKILSILVSKVQTAFGKFTFKKN